MELHEGVFLSLLAVAVGLLATMAVSDKTLRGYYMGSPNESNKGYCISADINWTGDPVVYCSDDIQKTLAVYERLKGGR